MSEKKTKRTFPWGRADLLTSGVNYKVKMWL